MPDNYYSEVNENGVVTPFRDLAAYNGVIANTKLIKDTVGWSGKNKWDKSKTVGIDATITQTSDGFRAQVSSHTWGSARCDFPTPTKNKDFILSCKANVATAGNFMKMQVYGSTDGSDYSNSIAVTDIYSATKELELAFNSGNYNYLRITLYLTNGTATSADVTFEKPMLRDASILDSTYEPYFGSTAFPRSEQAVLGAKNLLPVPYLANTKTTAGITFTNNSDGTITISGTNSGESSYHNLYVTENPNTSKLPLGKDLIYSLGIADNLGIQARIEMNNVAIALEAEATKRFTMPTSYTKVLITIRVPANTVISSPIIVKPMIRLASDPDDTYAPYVPTNKELLPRDEQAILGAVNILPQNAKYQSGSGVTYTVNADGTVTITGTASAVTQLSNIFVANEDYKNVYLSGIPATGLNCYITLTDMTTSTDVVSDIGEGTSAFNLVKGHQYNCKLISGATAVFTNPVTVSPMISLVKGQAYVPHAMTNKELTPHIVPITTNANTLLKEGTYLYTALISDAPAINLPAELTNRVARLEVKEIAGIGQLNQVLYTHNKADFWIRAVNNGTWTNWFKFSGTEVTS